MKTMKTPAELAAMSRPAVKALPMHETITYVVRVGSLFIGRKGLVDLGGAIHSHSAKSAGNLLALMKTFSPRAGLADAVIMARGRGSLTVVQS